ncbi:Sterol desaturase/sphingolipid hydroxylase, fatty acid hydroxylase superfamily [Chitinophaga jiangningensis]|uniref:Sterol desaturase/sphingolipid hydroxylase, fatty acid hydroxylase superfamily n=1 Tax=Chitinophaga jiangningensis TaxID=1419482 RepID=A0A1M6YJL7_9BACT|nr:sterol desaturase family protein [Chitinophaga jiangningensis]SHL18437.1 Sterol desaturase/sphingolipid hydroxylase, fatty acid hydroxylase superfamily [Chitinophaga jiangningensis]
MPPQLIIYAIPGFVLLILAEIIITTIDNRHRYETKDAASSIAMGLGNVFTGLFTKTIILGTYMLVYEKIRVYTLGFEWWVWILCFFADDFSYYWFHRISHSVRFFWASHVIHHSSEKYYLATALRQTWTGNFTGTFLFWLWMPFVGFHPVMVMTMQAISLIYQFWIHTEVIHKLPKPFEYILNTPSHHRVHHGSDLNYLDKNHGGILIIWDRLFGTFTAEQERPTYGLTSNIHTYNPLRIATHEWVAIWQDLRHSKSIKEALHYLFDSPGWSADGSRKTTKQLRQSQQNQ